TYQASRDFLRVMKRFYVNRMNETLAKKNRMIDSLTSTPGKALAFDSLRRVYQNDAVYTTLTNRTAMHRVIKIGDRLVQKVYPIYFKDHEPKHALDFRSKFFAPEKHLGGVYIDTLKFNLGIIWFMSFLLYFALYYDGLKRFIRMFGSQKKRRRANN
ncbi:MAG: ABC transporter ATP-binding protein, partial [Cytophagales bacterium]|nr:ABC transporter ATP-binding protein [Cytophagales bacterium]